MPEKKKKTQTPPSWTQAQRTRCAHHFRELYFLFFAQVNTKQEHVFFRLQAQPKWVCPETENTEQIKSLSQQSKTDLSGWSMASLRLNNKDLEQWHIHRSLAGKRKKKEVGQLKQLLSIRSRMSRITQRTAPWTAVRTKNTMNTTKTGPVLCDFENQLYNEPT